MRKTEDLPNTKNVSVFINRYKGTDSVEVLFLVGKEDSPYKMILKIPREINRLHFDNLATIFDYTLWEIEE